MKTIKFIILSIIVSNLLFAQITFEKTYNKLKIFQLVNLSLSGYKYCVIDSINPNTVKLYNMNHTLWKTIHLNYPPDFQIISIDNVSETLFNNDALVEVAYNCLKSNPIEYVAKIINENGTILFTTPIYSGLYLQFASAGTNGAKMFVRYKPSLYSLYSSDVYGLPGEFLPNVKDINNDNIELNAFPNPTSNYITITYDIPSGKNEGELVIYNLMGSEIARYKVDRSFNHILINTTEFSSGTYFYRVISDNIESKTNKFIIE